MESETPYGPSFVGTSRNRALPYTAGTAFLLVSWRGALDGSPRTEPAESRSPTYFSFPSFFV